MNALAVRNLHISVNSSEILDGVTLTVRAGETHVLMGPNGSGKSTLAMTIIGHPSYTVTKGTATFRGKNVLKLKPEERARLGLFLSFQHPTEVAGVSFTNFIRSAYRGTKGTVLKNVREYTEQKMHALGFGGEFSTRNLNDGLSGGEKKRSEIVQMAMLQPRMALLDEPDSGLDIDALRAVFRGISKVRGRMGLLVITHNPKVTALLKPDRVHIMVGGRIVRSGDRRLTLSIEKKGYGWLMKGSKKL
ncbi:MAG: Fe-S cluster assembly ATPase SufC [Candidatus Kerfeldbacteria bacterium]